MMPDRLNSSFFSRDKIIRSKLVNLVGGQVVRTLLARAIYNLRPSLHSDCADGQETLRRDGLLVIPNFHPLEEFDQLRQEAIDFLSEAAHSTTRHAGPNTLEIVDIGRHVDSLPEAQRFFDNSRLRKLLEGAERRRVSGYGVRTLERLVQGPPNGTRDPETDLHSDIFYPVHKCWLYLTDVSLDSGPLVFVKGSHHLSVRRLMYLYRESCGPNTGSRRISSQELEDVGLDESVLTCKMNTLVIANTLGYHRRMLGQLGAERIALHESLRSRPFALR